MKKVTMGASIAFFLGVISSGVYAESADFNSQVDAFYTKTDHSKTYVANYTYYLDTIKPGNTPLAEAVFFSRSSAFSIGIRNSDTVSSSINFDGKALTAAYLYSEQTNPFIFEIGYTKQDDDISTSSATGDAKRTSYDITLGYYFTNNLLATIQYYDSETIFNHPGIANTSAELSSYSASVKYIHNMQDSTALSIIGSRSHSTASTNISAENTYGQTSLSATYYFNQFIGLGAVYSKSESDTATLDSSYIGIKASYFITPTFYITAYRYEINETASTVSDYSLTSIIASLRF